MSIGYIRDHYKVPAKRGGRVRYSGGSSGPVEGVIISTYGNYIRVRLDTTWEVLTLHPSWKVEYL